MRRIDWECPECGLVISGMRPPAQCPACGESGELFEPVEYDMDDDEWFEDELNEEEEDDSEDDSEDLAEDLDEDEEDEEDEVDLDEEDQAVLRAVHEVFGFVADDDEDAEDLDAGLDLDDLE